MLLRWSAVKFVRRERAERSETCVLKLNLRFSLCKFVKLESGEISEIRFSRRASSSKLVNFTMSAKVIAWNMSLIVS